jgi:hypothetical protein
VLKHGIEMQKQGRDSSFFIKLDIEEIYKNGK